MRSLMGLSVNYCAPCRKGRWQDNHKNFCDDDRCDEFKRNPAIPTLRLESRMYCSSRGGELGLLKRRMARILTYWHF